MINSDNYKTIDYFNIYSIDKKHIIKELKKIFKCDIEYGRYKYNQKTCKKTYTEKYYFCIKINKYPNSYFKKYKDYIHFTTSEALGVLLDDKNYIKNFVRRHKHIFKDYSKEIKEYTEQKMVYYKLLNNNAQITLNKSSISIKIIAKNYHSFNCYYDLRSFNQLKNFFKDIEYKIKNDTL